MSEKTEKATAYKLQKAKEKGHVSRSIELTAYLSLLITLSVLIALWPQSIQKIQNIITHLFYLAGHMQFTVDHLAYLNRLIWNELLTLWLPIAGASMLAIILSTLVQTGIIWAPTAIVPDFKRINIVQGYKKLCSSRSLFEAGKAIIKLLSASFLLTLIFKHHLSDLLESIVTNPQNNTHRLTGFFFNTVLKLVLLLFLLAFIDKQFARWKFNKEQRMSKQEVKEEYRQKEGDPKIKNKIKQVQYQLRQKTAALKQVKTADVIITNPTHLAIALKYERHTMPAPKVIYKAQNKMVLQVKELAKKYGIPVIEHKLLARMLHHSTELNQYIHRELFPLTASIFRDLYQQRSNNE